jgi:hypothetical protein
MPQLFLDAVQLIKGGTESVLLEKLGAMTGQHARIFETRFDA